MLSNGLTGRLEHVRSKLSSLIDPDSIVKMYGFADGVNVTPKTANEIIDKYEKASDSYRTKVKQKCEDKHSISDNRFLHANCLLAGERSQWLCERLKDSEGPTSCQVAKLDASEELYNRDREYRECEDRRVTAAVFPLNPKIKTKEFPTTIRPDIYLANAENRKLMTAAGSLKLISLLKLNPTQVIEGLHKGKNIHKIHCDDKFNSNAFEDAFKNQFMGNDIPNSCKSRSQKEYFNYICHRTLDLVLSLTLEQKRKTVKQSQQNQNDELYQNTIHSILKGDSEILTDDRLGVVDFLSNFHRDQNNRVALLPDDIDGVSEVGASSILSIPLSSIKKTTKNRRTKICINNNRPTPRKPQIICFEGVPGKKSNVTVSYKLAGDSKIKKISNIDSARSLFDSAYLYLSPEEEERVEINPEKISGDREITDILIGNFKLFKNELKHKKDKINPGKAIFSSNINVKRDFTDLYSKKSSQEHTSVFNNRVHTTNENNRSSTNMWSCLDISDSFDAITQKTNDDDANKLWKPACEVSEQAPIKIDFNQGDLENQKLICDECKNGIYIHKKDHHYHVDYQSRDRGKQKEDGGIDQRMQSFPLTLGALQNPRSYIYTSPSDIYVFRDDNDKEQEINCQSDPCECAKQAFKKNKKDFFTHTTAYFLDPGKRSNSSISSQHTACEKKCIFTPPSTHSCTIAPTKDKMEIERSKTKGLQPLAPSCIALAKQAFEPEDGAFNTIEGQLIIESNLNNLIRNAREQEVKRKMINPNEKTDTHLCGQKPITAKVEDCLRASNAAERVPAEAKSY